jgi:hypothetical protein
VPVGTVPYYNSTGTCCRLNKKFALQIFLCKTGCSFQTCDELGYRKQGSSMYIKQVIIQVGKLLQLSSLSCRNLHTTASSSYLSSNLTSQYTVAYPHYLNFLDAESSRIYPLREVQYSTGSQYKREMDETNFVGIIVDWSRHFFSATFSYFMNLIQNLKCTGNNILQN